MPRIAAAVAVLGALAASTSTRAVRADETTLAAPQTSSAGEERIDVERLGRGCAALSCRRTYLVTATLPLPKALPDRYESAFSTMKAWIVGRSWHLRDDLAFTILQGDRYATLSTGWLPTATLSLGPAFAGSGTVVGLRIPF